MKRRKLLTFGLLILMLPSAALCGNDVPTVIRNAGVTQYLVGFAQFAVGYWNPEKTGYWTTNFVLRNDSSADAVVTLHFFGNDGQPISVPVIGGTPAAQQTVTVPAGGSREINLDPMSTPNIDGWVGADYANSGIKGQAIFIQHFPSGEENEAVVAMVSQMQQGCIIPIPGTTAYSMPFDNTGGRVSSYAFANTTSQAVTMKARFFGQNNEFLGEFVQELVGFAHAAFASIDRVTEVSGQKGTMRLEGAGVIPIGFRFNQNSFTTWLER